VLEGGPENQIRSTPVRVCLHVAARAVEILELLRVQAILVVPVAQWDERVPDLNHPDSKTC
jgi:hypothetical protein